MYTFLVDNVLRVIDGDTMVVRLDLGFNVSYRADVRLLNVDTPERKGKSREAAEVVAQAVSTWLASTRPLRLLSFQWMTESKGREKYGRVLGDFCRDTVSGETLTDYLIKNGLARRYLAGARKPWTSAELTKIAAFKP